MGVAEMYNYLMVELSAPYTSNWLIVSTPYPLILLTLGYLYFIFYAGPRYMKGRPPYELKTFILLYDLFQILANAWFVKEHISAGWMWKVYPICRRRIFMPLDTDIIFSMFWWLYHVRCFDYVETCIFVLRKKQNQVSALHVYHHISILIFGWYYLKYILDERASIVTLFNCTVHVIMYTYYFIAAWSPDIQQMISPIKPYVTKLQLVQFILLIIILMQIVNPECDVSAPGITPLFIGNLCIFLYLFYDFYKKTYTSKQKSN